MKTLWLALALACLCIAAIAQATTHSVTLNWTASTSTGVTGYNVYRSTTSGGPYSQINQGLTACCTFTDTVVTAGTTYFYVVRAFDGTTESANSNQASATVPSAPVAPTGLSATAK